MKNLNLGETYNLIDTYESEGSECNHCGRPIKNVCIIETEDKSTYSVGSGCVKSLLELDGSDFWKNKEINKQISQYFSMIHDIKKAERIVYNDYFFGIKLKNRKTGEIKTKLFYMSKVKNIDKRNWEYNNGEDTNCINSMIKYLLKK